MDEGYKIETQTPELLYKEVEKIRKNAGNTFLTGREYKKWREKWVLARFLIMYNYVFNETIMYWKESEAPDFICYDYNKTREKYYEVIEILKTGQKRGDEYKRPIEDFRPIPKYTYTDSWGNFQKDMSKKLRRAYGNCELIIYYDVWTFYLSEKEFAQQLKQNTEKLFHQTQSNFPAIWLVTSDNKYFFCLYPEFEEILFK